MSEPTYTERELTLAVNEECSCGGGGPEDEHTCQACRVYHRMHGRTVKVKEAMNEPIKVSRSKTAAVETWDVFTRHHLTYDDCLNVMVSTVKMIGHKAANDEVGAFCHFLHKALQVCPELGKEAGVSKP